MRRVAFMIGMLLWALMCAPEVILSQVKPWEAMGPDGGRLRLLLQNRGNPSLLLACSQGDFFRYPGGRFFKSTDKGETWSYLSFREDYESKLVWDPVDPSLVFLCRFWYPCRCERSSDGGRTWQPLEHPSALSITDLALDPSDHTILHAAVLVDFDPATGRGHPAYACGRTNGSMWTTTVLSTEPGWEGRIEIDNADPTHIYIAGGEVDNNGNGYAKLWRSTDAGGSFSALGLPAGVYLDQIVADPSIPGKLYGRSYERVYVSTDDGASWIGGDTLHPICLAVADGVVYVGTNDHGVWKSADGLTYSPLPGSEDPPGSWSPAGQTLCVQPGTPHTLLFANTMGVLKSTDGGASWKACNCGLTLGAISSVICSPGSPGALLAARMNMALFKTLDASDTPVVWQQLPEFYACGNISDITLSPTDPNVILALEGNS